MSKSTKSTRKYASRSASAVRSRRIVREYLRASIMYHAFINSSDKELAESVAHAFQLADAQFATLEEFRGTLKFVPAPKV